MPSPYKAVNFEKDAIIRKSDMDQIVNNLQWINDNTPRGIYLGDNNRPANNMKLLLLAGRTLIAKSPKSKIASAKVNFGKHFAAKAQPHVTTGTVCDYQRKIFVVVNGPGGADNPTASGFEINIAFAGGGKDTLKRPFWVHWHAFGQRAGD